MNKIYTMDKEVRNSFKRILKDISYNADISWEETTDDAQSRFVINCSENVIQLIDKFSSKLKDVKLVVHTKPKFQEEIEEIVHSLQGRFSKGAKKGYYIVILDRVHHSTFKSMTSHLGDKINISQGMF